MLDLFSISIDLTNETGMKVPTIDGIPELYLSIWILVVVGPASWLKELSFSRTTLLYDVYAKVWSYVVVQPDLYMARTYKNVL